MQSTDQVDWVQWRGLRVQDASATLPSLLQRRSQLDTTVHLLNLPDSWDAFRSALPRNMKEAIRKCYNSLARDNIKFEFRVVDAPSAIPAALDRVFALHAARSTDFNSVKHADVFASPASRSFLRDYCAELADRGQLRIFQLVVDGEIVATRIGFVFADELYLYYSGYDLRLGKYSIMTTVVAEAIKWAIDNKLRIVNLSTGTDVSKTRWRPDIVEYAGGFSVQNRLKSRALFDLVRRYRGW